MVVVLQSVLDGPSNRVSYNSESRMSGMGETSSQCHHHKRLRETARLGLVVEQLGVSCLACVEQTARRFAQIGKAVERSPQRTALSGLDVLTNSAVA